MIAAGLAAAITVAFSGEVSTLHRDWGLVPADASRPGLWKARPLRGESVEILVRIDTSAAGEVLREEWSAESGHRQVDIPDDRFWQILDGRSGTREWIETDPDALPAGVLSRPSGELAQGFRCPACRPALVAATWSGFGATRLLIARNQVPTPVAKDIEVSPGVTEEGIESLARQRGLSVDSRNPCKIGTGTCSLDLLGSRSERWSLARASGSSPWRLERASFVASAWWNPEWSWDSLRTESPREFALVLRNWLDAELDVVGERLVRPIEPILTVGTSQWSSREIDGLGTGPTVDRLVNAPQPPASLELSRGGRLRVSIDSFGRRVLEFPKVPR